MDTTISTVLQPGHSGQALRFLTGFVSGLLITAGIFWGLPTLLHLDELDPLPGASSTASGMDTVRADSKPIPKPRLDGPKVAPPMPPAIPRSLPLENLKNRAAEITQQIHITEEYYAENPPISVDTADAPRPPFASVQRLYTMGDSIRVLKVQFCNMNAQQLNVAWTNALTAISERYPSHAKYCASQPTNHMGIFVNTDGQCQVRIRCAKTVDGIDLLRGSFVIAVDESTQQVEDFLKIAW